MVRMLGGLRARMIVPRIVLSGWTLADSCGAFLFDELLQVMRTSSMMIGLGPGFVVNAQTPLPSSVSHDKTSPGNYTLAIVVGQIRRNIRIWPNFYRQFFSRWGTRPGATAWTCLKLEKMDLMSLFPSKPSWTAPRLLTSWHERAYTKCRGADNGPCLLLGSRFQRNTVATIVLLHWGPVAHEWNGPTQSQFSNKLKPYDTRSFLAVGLLTGTSLCDEPSVRAQHLCLLTSTTTVVSRNHTIRGT